jgi:hypothetical protein
MNVIALETIAAVLLALGTSLVLWTLWTADSVAHASPPRRAAEPCGEPDASAAYRRAA